MNVIERRVANRERQALLSEMPTDVRLRYLNAEKTLALIELQIARRTMDLSRLTRQVERLTKRVGKSCK